MVLNGNDAGARSDRVEILDCTIRDGAYSVDFQVGRATIEGVLQSLEDSGIRYIEIGHGCGLNGHTVSRPAAVSDQENFEIARRVLKKAAWGAIIVPGVGHIEHVEQAAAAGASFMRIGTNVTQTEQAESFVKRAKELGLFTCMNLMKTQVVSDEDLVEIVKRGEGYGTDAIYLVDSFGSLLPEQTTRLFELVGAHVGVPLGFHGHDNLGLANANALAAVGAGAKFVDTTLDGMGRGAGNAVTEQVAAVLGRMGVNDAYDAFRLARASEDLIQPLERLPESRHLQLAGGFAGLHSGYFPAFREVAGKAGVDVAELMVSVSKIDAVDPSTELMTKTAEELKAVAAAG